MNTDKFIVPIAVEFFWDVLKVKRCPEKRHIFFHIHKGSIRALDCVGPKSHDTPFHNFFAHLSVTDVPQA